MAKVLAYCYNTDCIGKIMIDLKEDDLYRIHNPIKIDRQNGHVAFYRELGFCYDCGNHINACFYYFKKTNWLTGAGRIDIRCSYDGA